jgi:hypothetical protein
MTLRLSLLFFLVAVLLFPNSASAQIVWPEAQFLSLEEILDLGPGRHAQDMFEAQKAGGNPDLQNLNWQDLYAPAAVFSPPQPYWVPEGHYVGELTPEGYEVLQGFAIGAVVGGPVGAIAGGVSIFAGLATEQELKLAGFTDYEAEGIGDGVAVITGLFGSLRPKLPRMLPRNSGNFVTRNAGRPSRVFSPAFEEMEGRIVGSGLPDAFLNIPEMARQTNTPLVRLAITNPREYGNAVGRHFGRSKLGSEIGTMSSAKHTREGFARMLAGLAKIPVATAMRYSPQQLLQEGVFSGLAGEQFSLWGDTDAAEVHAHMAFENYLDQHFLVRQTGAYDPQNLEKFIKLPTFITSTETPIRVYQYLGGEGRIVIQHSASVETRVWLYPLRLKDGSTVVIPALKHFVPYQPQ